MARDADNASMAVFCDFENVALGVRDAQYEKFDIRPVLERLLAKGSIVVKKAYCDWDRYKTFKAAMHEANFELIEIPHVRQSGKNSADIRLVVDALDLCYTKSHVDTFVIVSGDSDFSPLVSKLRENAKRVIGVGVKQSCSDLLIANCDEFIYYDDLVRERNGGRRENREAAPRRTPEEESGRREKLEARKTKAIELAAATFADLMADRGESEKIWASVLKEVIKRRNPGFNESYFGFRSFGNLLEEAAKRGLLGVGRDEKSGAYVTRAQARPVVVEAEAASEASVVADNGQSAVVEPLTVEVVAEESTAPSGNSRRRGGRRSRKEVESKASPEIVASTLPEPVVIAPEPVPVDVPAEASESAAPTQRRRGGRRPRKEAEVVAAPVVVEAPQPVAKPEAAADKKAEKKADKAAAKPRKPRSRKPEAAEE
jgi:uncharacterized protein (TIGR00288 family)